MPKAFTFKNRDGLLESLLEVDEFKTVGENALIWDPDNPKKERFWMRRTIASTSAISEDGDYCYDCYEYYRDDEEEEEEKTKRRRRRRKRRRRRRRRRKEEYEEYEEYEDEEQDDKDRTVYEQSDKE
ncbi:hypothetical protein BASA81_007499 [Batrachochytrium salamandrivorans]|nr:hypothetical protein BASA81_007499 [Batrachochytrium salamandrivorans]